MIDIDIADTVRDHVVGVFVFHHVRGCGSCSVGFFAKDDLCVGPVDHICAVGVSDFIGCGLRIRIVSQDDVEEHVVNAVFEDDVRFRNAELFGSVGHNIFCNDWIGNPRSRI